MPITLNTRDTGFETAFAAFPAGKRENAADVDAAVAEIIEQVATRGDAALIEYTKRFDRIDLAPATLRLTQAEIAAGADAAPADTVAALRLAAERIESFHRHQLPAPIDYVDPAGVRLGLRWRPITAAGLYVPGGTAAYPSSVLMNAIPGKVAGVERLVMTVPAPNGVLNPLVLAAARLVGIDEIYRVGGAQAVAALAHGTATIKPVDKIVGPGNAYVAAAKRRVFGRVGIDMIAGPSEILVVADRHNNPAWIAADLLSQAEHDAAAQAILVTDSREFAAAVEAAAASHLKHLPRADIARASWQANSAILIVADWDQAVPLIDRIAPEHLELAIEDPDALAAHVDHAGASSPTPQRIAAITLDERTVIRRSRAIEDERAAAITDLLKENHFAPVSGLGGPYRVHLAVEENRLMMEIRGETDGASESIVLPL